MPADGNKIGSYTGDTVNMEKIIIKINDKEFESSYNKLDSSMIVNGKHYEIELLKNYTPEIFSFAVNNKICQIEIEVNEDGTSSISLDGFTHEIEITDETKILLKKFITENAGDAAKSAKIKSPMPGLVIKILKEEGHHVVKGDKVIILEAMKMENTIASPIDGVIKSIKVREGVAVEKDALMLEIESE